MPNTIIYPTINLYLYDLKEGLGEDERKVAQNSQEFWQKIDSNLDEKTLTPKHKNTDADIIQLLDTPYHQFPAPLDGWYYPLQIGDTYALQVNYSGKFNPNGKFNDDAQSLDEKPFYQLQQEILQKIAHKIGTIGQTWVLSGKLTGAKTESEIEKIALESYSQILTNSNWQRDIIGKGTLLGGTLFELWYRPENTGLTAREFWDKFRQESHHILIWLFPDNQTPDEMRQNIQFLYYDFLRLFQYRHKIIWAYHQSLYHKSLLKKEYIEIQPAINGIRQLTQAIKNQPINLTQIQKTLSDSLISLSDYTLALNYLENQGRTIEVNLRNYEERINYMIKKYPRSDIKVIAKFSSEIYGAKYHRQVVSDCQNFQPGLTLLKNMNSTIQGIINLEQTKSDRALDDTIAIAGIGVSLSGLTATAISIQQPPPNSYTNFSFLASPVFVLSFLPSAPFLIILIYRLFHSQKK
ncbi:MAG TPA: hypothetical protein DEG17_23310 [Cyanobacteria bacterium UBA11149]|nr:hypothetical protein [Cyanobacteria bacterium UBA11367]HBE56977.1 hypothetical protein [Cyanobacteria bacterium UBA11366]HBK62922.1 hypothetical protein [Cyanobacteria bacterium UBA11166]HBR73192.1 hypothetical protein [Cyanobacteria bacterium UBA11159]HBW91710.1 hypothetical protein [Cyanobacteria bacterium UBA11149]HCA96890.1 hypothetical protein [Cyanobacteria bacterium UBA9226]